MATHPSVEADPMTDANCTSQRNKTAEVLSQANREQVQPFKTLSTVRDVAPIAYMPPRLAENLKARNLRRLLTREQGRALETIGHAVDYLNDCYLYEGDEDELINVGGSATEAIQILVSMRWQILQSAPVREPRTFRLWNALFHRHTDRRPRVAFHRSGDRPSQSKSAIVLPLSSSR